MNESKKLTSSRKESEAGYGVIIVIVLVFFLFVMVLAGVASSMSANRSQDNLQTRQTEKWEAKSALATMRRVLQVRIPEKYQDHITVAKNCLEQMGRTVAPLQSFDEQNLISDSSVPVVFIERGGVAVCNDRATAYTSLLGSSDAWLQFLTPFWESDARSFGYTADNIKVARLAEQLRRYNSAGDPVYDLGFTIDARGGQFYRVRDDGEVLLGNLSENCGATGRLEITPRTVTQGNPVVIKVTYSSVSQLKFFRHQGVTSEVINTVSVVEQPAAQEYSFSYTPEDGYSYSVEATSSVSGCFSRSERIPVTVTVVSAPACPTIDVLTASPNAVQSGETSTVAWSVSNAAEVTLDGTIVPLSGSQPFIIVADRTFNLNARDAANTCPAARQVSVTVLAAPCLTPVFTQFSVTPASAAPGATVTITWQINNLMVGATVNLLLPDGSVQSVGASGSVQVAAPAVDGTYNYSIQAKNPCSGVVTQTAQVQVVTSCTNPSLSGFTATPNSVVAGGSQPIQFTWGVAGTVSALSISSIGNVSGTSYTLNTQPQTTTNYVLSATGCGTTVTQQVTVTVSSLPSSCQNGQHLVAANRSIANAPAVFPYQSSRLEISARADFDEATRTIKFNFEIIAPAPAGVTDPEGYETLGYANPFTGGNGFVEVGNLRFFTLTAPPRVAVYENTGTFPGRFITTLPLNYIGGSGSDYFRINGNVLGSPGVDVPFTFDNTFNPLTDSLIINSRNFPVYEVNTNGGGGRFNAINQVRNTRFGCANN